MNDLGVVDGFVFALALLGSVGFFFLAFQALRLLKQ